MSDHYSDKLALSLHQERSELLLAVSGNAVSAGMGWQILHRWDALVEIAKAARVMAVEAGGRMEGQAWLDLRAALSALDGDT